MRIVSRAAYDNRVFWGAVALVVGIKLVLAALLPMTGDEAYFVQYARNVDWGGFYDHPPMVGWLLWLLAHVSDDPITLRLPAIATALIVGLGLYLLLRPIDEAKARLIALIMLFSPVYLINVLITTDTALIAFGFLSAIALQQALRREQWPLFALAGALLGLAFLSKYFAVLLGLAYLALLPLAGRHHWRGFLVLFMAALPFGLLNLAWNYFHCWNHVMFNLFNRQSGGEFSLVGLAVYGVMLIYLFALPAWYLLRDRGFLYRELRITGLGALVCTGIVPLLAFALLAPLVDIGLHWVLLFVPLVMAGAVLLSREDLDRSARFMAWFGGAHALILGMFLAVSVQVFDGREFARDAVFYLAPGRFVEALAAYEGDFHATDSYSRAAVAAYYAGRHWSVFGTGSRHARQDDTLTDWRGRDGGRMVYFSRNHEVDVADLEPYFDTVEVETFDVAGQRFEVAIAQGFDFERYHAEVLTRIRERYYDFPAVLPMGGCPFVDRYFGAGAGCR